MSSGKSKGASKTEVVDAPVAGWTPPASKGKKGPGPRPCGSPEVPKTDDIGVKGEGGEFIKRGGKLIRS